MGLRYYYFSKLFKITISNLVKAILDNPFDFIFKKMFFLLRQINLTKFDIGIAHTPFFFKKCYRYFKDSDQTLFSKKNQRKYRDFLRETINLKNSFFLKNLKFGMLKNYAETLMSSRLTFLNLVSLHTKLLSLKTDKFSICLSRFLRFKKSKIRNLLDKKIVDDNVISDKFLVKTKKSI